MVPKVHDETKTNPLMSALKSFTLQIATYFRIQNVFQQAGPFILPAGLDCDV